MLRYFSSYLPGSHPVAAQRRLAREGRVGRAVWPRPAELAHALAADALAVTRAPWPERAAIIGGAADGAVVERRPAMRRAAELGEAVAARHRRRVCVRAHRIGRTPRRGGGRRRRAHRRRRAIGRVAQPCGLRLRCFRIARRVGGVRRRRAHAAPVAAVAHSDTTAQRSPRTRARTRTCPRRCTCRDLRSGPGIRGRSHRRRSRGHRRSRRHGRSRAPSTRWGTSDRRTRRARTRRPPRPHGTRRRAAATPPGWASCRRRCAWRRGGGRVTRERPAHLAERRTPTTPSGTRRAPSNSRGRASIGPPRRTR